MRFSQSTHVQMYLPLKILTSITRTGFPILVELIDLVNSVMIFPPQMNLLRWLLTFLLGSQTESHSLALLDLFLSSDASICSTMAFPLLGNSDHIFFSVSIGFSSNSQQDALFHCIADDYSCADWDGPCNHLRDVPWKVIFELGASAAASEFLSRFRLKLMYISLIESIRSNLTHFHDFQLLVLMP